MSQILYRDDSVLAVAKPTGQAVIPGRDLPEEPLNRELERVLGRRVYVAHRLDREASGIVVFALSAEAHARLCAHFESRRAKKIYWAAVQGEMAGPGVIDEPLRGGTLLEIDLITGRRHQIRVHLYSIGHPILGDPLYGRPRPVGGAPRLMLHHVELSLPGLRG